MYRALKLSDYYYAAVLLTKECLKTRRGTEYNGNMNRTESGRTCRKWSAYLPYGYNLQPELGSFLFGITGIRISRHKLIQSI